MVKYVLIPRPGEGAELVANGVPSMDADLVFYLFTTVLDGCNCAWPEKRKRPR
jgi:hypothetical protein